MLWIAILLSGCLSCTCFLLCRAYGKIQHLEERDSRSMHIIHDLRDERIDDQVKIRELRETIAKSEELMQEYDDAFRGVAKLMDKYPRN